MTLIPMQHTIILFILTLFIAGCGGGQIKTETEGVVLHQGLIKDSKTNLPLKNVEVIMQNKVTYTDEEGFYEFHNLLPHDHEVIIYKKENYLKNSKIISLKTYSDDSNLSLNFIELFMYKHDYTLNYSNSSQKIVKEDFTLDLPDLTHNTKEIYTNISYFNTNSRKNKMLFPGKHEGKNYNGTATSFLSFALFNIEFKDTNNTNISIHDNMTLTFKNLQNLTSDTIALWYFDYQQGIWIEDGYMTRLDNGYYKGEISHSGMWSLSQPVTEENGIYSGYIIDAEGIPMTNIRVYAVGDHWIKCDLSTDSEGKFEINVIPNENFQLYAYDYQNKFSAAFPNKIDAIAAGETVEE